MGKLVCQCGHVISDVQYPCPHAYDIVRQRDLELALEELTSLIDIVQQLEGDAREHWLSGRFSCDYPMDATNAEIVHDAFSEILRKCSRYLLTCPRCGRLHIQSETGLNHYETYLPANHVTGLSK